MITFLCNKLGRDKCLEGFKVERITPFYKILSGRELGNALKDKLIEESEEVKVAHDHQGLMTELADVLEVIDGMCKAYGISFEDLLRIKKEKYQKRGGFEKGLFLEMIKMDENNPKINYFRASPDKYPEI